MDLTRVRLRKGNKISLSDKPDRSSALECTIHGFIGEGGSSVCYAAEYGGKKGRLKEFYPIDTSVSGNEQYIFLKRSNKTRQLIPVGAGMAERFKQMCDDFTGAYITLEAAKANDSKNEVLNNFIPPYMLLYGADEGEAGSIYVWTPDDKTGKGFNQYLAAVRKYPKRNPERNLHNILATTRTLTDCVKALHSAGLLHLDIKPSNFLVTYDSSYDINTAHISLFDINTLYRIGSSFHNISGTDGFKAPEVSIGKAENRSDIYSIGATLFSAIIICDEIKDGIYLDEYYPRIDQLVSDSALITASEDNSYVYLRALLSSILKKCLAKRPQSRYSCCEELIEDLDKAQSFLLPSMANAKLTAANKKLALVDAEQPKETCPTAIIQNLLYKNPLLNWMPEGSSTINVLVFGAGTYAQKFIDVCLQAGQIHGYEINIKAISNAHETDRDVYLQFRPAIDKFVNVNGSLNGSGKEIYANLNFEAVPKGNQAITKKNAVDIVTDIMDEYQYIFIALGDDNLNQAVAKACEDAAKILDVDCSVNYAVYSTGKKRPRGNRNPVCVNEPITTDTIDPDLERMALNTHLSWMGSLNVDMKKARGKFRERYNYESSLSYALSIPYKLRALGINMKETGLSKAAELFSQATGDPDIFNNIVASEHRRWVMEKITNGWVSSLDAQGNIDYESCIAHGDVKDKQKKLHPCIVRSTSATPLSKNKGKNHALWDEGDIDPSLDELDKMSVELHRCFKRRANEMKKKYSLYGGDMESIKLQIADMDDTIIIAYNRFLLCLKNIMDGSQSYSRQYGYYRDLFAQSLKLAPDETARDVNARLKLVDKAMFAVIQSNMYEDYKSKDEVLILKTPFILTYSTQPYIAMAFDDGRADTTDMVKNDVIFSNVASATVLNPGKINYLYYFDEGAKVGHFINKLRAVLTYLDNRKIQCQVMLSIALPVKLPAKIKADLQAELKILKAHTRLNNYILIDCQDENAAIDMLIQSLKAKKIDMFDGSTLLFAALRNQLMRPVFNYRASDEFAYFEFDAVKKEFLNCKGSGHLQYITDNSFIKINDLFALQGARDDKFYFPEFADDYEALWDIYTGKYKKGGNVAHYERSVGHWNRMCDQLAKYSDDNDRFARFNLDPAKQIDETQLYYYFPDYGFKTAKYMVTRLVECGVLSAESNVYRYTSDTCRADIVTQWDVAGDMEKLFSEIHHMADVRFLKIIKALPATGNSRKFPQVNMYYDKLDVSGLQLTDSDGYIFAILTRLAQEKYISRLRRDTANKQVVSFTYSSQRLKKLLTTAGEILEVYTYYSALKTGFFDDIACGYEFKWAQGDVKNEIDCILTRGFKSLMVECKGRKQLEQDFYYKLDTLNKFGINGKKVLIANTYWGSEHVDSINEMQMARGKQMGVVTVSDPDDIINIGYTLRLIWEDRYNDV